MNRKFVWAAFAAGVLTIGLNGYSGYSPRGESKIGHSLKGTLEAAGSKVPVLIIMKEQADLSPAQQIGDIGEKRRFVYDRLRSTALSTQADVIAWLQDRKLRYRPFYVTNMIAVYDATAEVVEQLAARSDVAKVIGNPKVALKMPALNLLGIGDSSQSVSAVGDNIKRTGAVRLWEEFKNKGRGVVVAGQDTGVQWNHPALMKHYRGYSPASVSHAYSWHDAIHAEDGSGSSRCGYDLEVPCDDNSHGTHTMGTIVGDDGAANAIGMAPEAQWIACRNMDAGVGTPATYIECFEFFLAPYPHGGNPMTDGDPSKAPDVINNSWGCPTDEGCEGGEMLSVVRALSSAGIMVVASAGNDGNKCSTIATPPAQYSGEVLSVGAIDHRNDAIASFSSRGPSAFDGAIGPDLTAPGVNVRSSIPGDKYAGAMWSGTSMAGPHVAGAVALLWSVKPEYRGMIRPTVELLRRTAEPKTSAESCGGVPGSSVPNNTFGYGILNVYRSATSGS